MSSDDVLAVDREEAPHDDEDETANRIRWMFSYLESAVKMPSEIPPAILS